MQSAGTAPITAAEPAIPDQLLHNAGSKRQERFYSGPAGEEVLDYSFRYDGSGKRSFTTSATAITRVRRSDAICGKLWRAAR